MLAACCRRGRVLIAQRARAVPKLVHQHLGRLQVFVSRYTGHQTGRRPAHLRRRGRVSRRDGRVFAPLHQHRGLRVLRVSGRIAAGRHLENVRGRGRVFGPGTATVAERLLRPRAGVPEHVRFVQMCVNLTPSACHRRK